MTTIVYCPTCHKPVSTRTSDAISKEDDNAHAFGCLYCETVALKVKLGHLLDAMNAIANMPVWGNESLNMRNVAMDAIEKHGRKRT
jgi:endogenous inhibitor of DNA gyrase (YacG/DUF329 family)